MRFLGIWPSLKDKIFIFAKVYLFSFWILSNFKTAKIYLFL
ncbi:hypothetical protein LEP1GSC132_3015 [Leptospira kirschneri str. 200803703]|uniref:Uncharacterized protein n=2 Tax=Leptospira kirschneri TaxID=29507 RepID=A0A0E2AWZ6_9LEPT|nr:hypothetical protein LEP1GSC044_3768 [Leptospira kirschneri serovar Grippotyphosa str. RM52]EKO13419.1 hypothetical protein LEP1GSC081_2107 [Leptospira kirschneri str. H1]EKO49850.1 hypothetical protein LEP1GSC131_1004 [Leptospira kirschneri str. 200802841]EKO59763.1 hypothetical protein LEP1GSC082_1372 [Leptospira kirschneri str. H2]EKQ84565.1 hypothetical protein LEP1GSC064_1383 [Leptospira kirschneri serovar Grippotyphosa str. Moskva]EKR08846.1 hypothetical protein LEP1GSC122_0523 [Lepto